MITKEEYDQYAIDGFNVIPLIKKIDVVSDSPIKIYSKIKNKENTFLLESIEGGEKWAQYSIIGLDCKDTIKVSENEIEIKTDTNINLIESPIFILFFLNQSLFTSSAYLTEFFEHTDFFENGTKL